MRCHRSIYRLASRKVERCNTAGRSLGEGSHGAAVLPLGTSNPTLLVLPSFGNTELTQADMSTSTTAQPCRGTLHGAP